MRALVKVRDPTRWLRELVALGFSLEPEGYCLELDGITPAGAWAELWELVQALEDRGVQVEVVSLTWTRRSVP